MAKEKKKKLLLSPEDIRYNAVMNRSYKIWSRSLTDDQLEQLAITESILTMIVGSSSNKKVVDASYILFSYLIDMKESNKNSENIFK